MPFPAAWSHSDDSFYSSQPFFKSSPYLVRVASHLFVVIR